MVKKTAAVALIMLLAACSDDSGEESYSQMYESVNPEEWPEIVASVNGEEIHKSQIEEDFVDYTNAYGQVASSSEEEQLVVYERILTQLLTSEIETELLLQAAETEEIYVTDDELQEAIVDLRLERGSSLMKNMKK
ncbi:SurA N-terminal domain-containing protein [Bacillus sp. JCM 19041]|uniref:SurA N-terminal domain-containing protein n=1 Tax=Bacillus sp. JCM 19041 TaxID=1460637 RepID=UPI0006D2A0C9